MSRSFKKICSYKKNEEGFKRISNKSFRRKGLVDVANIDKSEVILKPSHHKKSFNSYNICDHKENIFNVTTWLEYWIDGWERNIGGIRKKYKSKKHLIEKKLSQAKGK